MTRRHLPVLLADRLYVPEHKVTREHKEAFTHIITQTAYVQEKGLPKRCGTCSWWMKAWKDNRDRKTFCHNLGYGEYDLCKDYEVRSIKDVVEEEVRTYKELPKHGYVAFARGDEGKLREVFGDKLIDRAEDDRSTRSLGIPLELGGPNKVVLRDYQRPLIRTWRKRGGIIIAPTGCHRKGTLVRLFDGSTKAVERVKVGDRLMGPDSTPRNVLRLYRGKSQMYQVTPVKGEPWVVTPDHVLSLVQTQTGEVTDVSVAEWLNWSATQKHLHKLYRTGVEYADAKVPLDPYFLGVLLGDGSVSGSIEVTNPDPEILSFTRKKAKEWGLRITEWTSGGGCPRLRLAGRKGVKNPLTEVLRELGVHGTTAGTKRVPDLYLHSSRKHRLALLSGLLDTDGHLSGGGYDYISKSEQLSRDVAELARSVGLAAYVASCEKRSQLGSGGTYWRVSISGDCTVIPCRVSRKKAGPRRQSKDVRRTGFSVKQVSTNERYYGFKLDGDQRYLLEDFTVTHNSGKGTMLCALIAKLKHRVLILSQEVRHLTAVMAELKESTNIDELQKQYDTPLMGMLQTKGRMAGKVYPITFATFQLFSHSNGRKLLKKIKDKFGHAHVEEVHHAAARTWFKTLSTLNPLFRTGSTATMERKDQLHPVIFDAIGPVVAESKTEMMPCEITYIKSGVFVPEQALRRFGQYKWGGMLTYVGNRPELMDTVTLNVMGDVAKGYKPLVISERRNFAIALAKNLEILGAKTKLIMGGEKKTVKQKRSLENQWKPVSDALARGDLNVIVGTGVMNEAVNIPPLSALHLPFPSANPGQEKQRAGRIRRPMKGKPTPQIRVYTFEGDPIAATGCHKTRRGVYAKLGFVTKGEQAPDRNPLVAREVSAKPGSKIRSLASLPVPVKARWSGGGG